MEILEFGDRNKRKIIFIHGFQCPYQIWEKYIEHYQKDYHIIIPIMPGHNPKKQEKFFSFLQTSRELEDYYISRYGKSVYAIYGMSMGGVLTATLWQNGQLEIEKVIFDGSPLVSVNGIMKRMMLQFYLNITHKSQQRDKKTLAQATKSICPQEYLRDFLQVLDNMSDTTIINYISEIANFRLKDDVDTPNTKIYFYYGTAVNELLAKKSAQVIAKNYSGSVIKCFKASRCDDSGIGSGADIVNSVSHIENRKPKLPLQEHPFPQRQFFISTAYAGSSYQTVLSAGIS